ncbi:transcriptional regulator [Streptococcus pneumoniae]|nr:helix-turn-helix transcriptional regulator [Streptococcus pneumoniae]OBX93386.1 DNA-binding protein [Streptococcus pneumoniae]CVO42388.1 transcriptional regulator [Streptococcus pneumoniae]CVR87613.1 transcriptional regulator [Streptococcus pneumoniae]CVV16310.1 transcriptional regulator [Streptococcus pneumoniae]
MREFGEKIKRLRLAKKISRSEFCGDESELSIRQLIRIENGESRPTLTKLKYIAERLGVEDYKLMPSYIELDKEYLELKYFLMRTLTYEDETIAQKKVFLLRFLKSIMIGYLRKKDLSSQIIHIWH